MGATGKGVENYKDCTNISHTSSNMYLETPGGIAIEVPLR